MQVLLNLASNAVKFTEHDAVHIAVPRLPDDDEAVSLRFVVTDTGIGIDSEWQVRLCADFVQVPGTRATQASGIGLGAMRCAR